MANEITLNVSATLKNPSTASAGGLNDQFAPGALVYNQTTQGKYEGVVATSTSDTVFPTLGLTTPGYCFLQNLDSTNAIDVGPTSGGAIVDAIRLLAGEVAVFRMKSGATYRHQADAGTPRLQIKVWEA